MIDYLQRLLGTRGLAPHGYCLFWDPALLWTHAIADAAIGLAYFSIPVAMAVFLMRRPDVRYRGIAWLFVLFILACGTTHFMSIWTLWQPDYGIEALIKVITAIASVATAIVLWPLLPRAIALPSPAQLEAINRDLEKRVAERDRALAALEAAEAERERAESILRQAQKMDAIGQLTGGIAHDFNNLLTVVIANVQRARRLGPGIPQVGKALDNALAGAEKAARLTDQLLAFARRQPLQPEVRDLNLIVRDTQELFSRSLGPQVTLRQDLDPALWPVRIDMLQAESALLNLLINARDAMPDGGVIIITTRNRPGQPDMVALEVRDTGTGMSADVRDKVFEPFFTTKGPGRGTGLGLAQVYGFIGQMGGDIEIDSAPGAGTAFLILLPRAGGGVAE